MSKTGKDHKVQLSHTACTTSARLARLYGVTEGQLIAALLAFREERWLKALNDIERKKYHGDELGRQDVKAIAARKKTERELAVASARAQQAAAILAGAETVLEAPSIFDAE